MAARPTPSEKGYDKPERAGRASQDDEDLRKLLEARRANIKVVGIGGAGNNTISRMMQVGVIGAEVVAVNTDAQDLLYTDADRKVLVGRELTRGLGAGADPQIGMEAAKENKVSIIVPIFEKRTNGRYHNTAIII